MDGMWTGTDHFETDGYAGITLGDGRRAEIPFCGGIRVIHYDGEPDVVEYDNFRTYDAVLLDEDGGGSEETVKVRTCDYEEEINRALWQSARHVGYTAVRD